MDFNDLLSVCQAEAFASKLEPTEQSVWRYICRVYSKKFTTPLDVVLKLDPEHVILNYYEEQLDDVKIDDHLEDLAETVFRLADPNRDQTEEENLKSYIKAAEKEEKERLKNNKPVHPSVKPSKKEVSEEIYEPKPAGGKVDLSHLQNEEIGSGGFKD